MFFIFSLFFLCLFNFGETAVRAGVDVFFSDGIVSVASSLKGKNVGLVTNHSAISEDFTPTYQMFLENRNGFHLKALFVPEHGFYGDQRSAKECKDFILDTKLPVYSLYGVNKRPTDEMLQGIEVLVYDIQEIGVRSYTYATTLYYIMEAAAKKGIRVIVLDRPNPIGGEIVDGPMLDNDERSFVGYIDIPYCHGMTIGELARYFNGEYKIQCNLTVVPMRGWRRKMLFHDTGLVWIPTSPQIPDSATALFCAMTGLMGDLGFLGIGIGSTLPFKIIGAPWIDAEKLTDELNKQDILGVHFVPFHYVPRYALYSGKECHGVYISVQDYSLCSPIKNMIIIMSVIKSMYPKIVEKKLASLTKAQRQSLYHVWGSKEFLSVFIEEKNPAAKLVEFQKTKRENFLSKRKKYLLYN